MRVQGATGAGALAPMSEPTYRWFWLAFTVSTVGTSMQALGAQWFLVSDGGSAGLVALVQAALTLPMAVLALPAGVLADRLDRRALLVVVQLAGFAIGVALAVISWRGLLGPHLLLVLTCLLGSAYALTLTPFQSLIPDVVARSQIHAAAALVSVAANIARVVGPAAAGVLVALVGVPAVFALSSLASAFFVVVLLRWREAGVGRRERERFFPAVRSGVRYVRHSPQVLKLMLRSFWFTAAMMSLFALLPSVATEQLRSGAGGYGLLFACLGAGAVGGGLCAAWLRQRMSDNTLVGASFLAAAVVVGALPLVSREPEAMVLVVLGGFAWTSSLSTMAGNLQVYLPAWVRARGLAIYSMALFGGQVAGSLVLGLVADASSLSLAFWAAAAALALGVPLARWLPMVSLDGLDRTPTAHWPEPVLVVPAHEIGGEVVVTVEYWVDHADEAPFRRGMQAVRRVRLRTGATSWRLLRDAETPRRYVEEYAVASWSEHDLQRHGRLVASDETTEALVVALSDPPPRVVHLFRIGLHDRGRNHERHHHGEAGSRRPGDPRIGPADAGRARAPAPEADRVHGDLHP